MAKFEFKLPDIGEGVTEGEVVAWHVKEGDRVAEDQVMVEVMTDKATVTIGAPKEGKIERLMADPGAMVQVGDVLVVIHTGNGSRAHGGQPAATAVGDIKESLPGTSYFGEKRAAASAARDSSPGVAASAAGAATASDHYDPKPLATPATRKLARDLHVDLRRVQGSGPGGRVTKQDVKLHSSSGTVAAPSVATSGGQLLESGPAPARLRSQPVARSKAHELGAGQRVPFVGMRRRIAENMSLSKNTAAHFTFVEECEVDRLVALRKDLQEDARERGVELTYLPFVIKAVVAALRKHPGLNSSLDTEKNELVMHEHCHIGIAAATDQGLVVPVIHHAESMSLLELAREVQRLGEAARDGQLTVQELQGSTFTVTSLGKQAGLFAVPIINYPNVGILGIHRMKERPVVRDGEIVIGRVMLLSLSLDHRIVDGHHGAAFAYDVIRYLEEPARLLLD
ncbi:MAG: dihydrolipoamide acetyltransferase family protein [Myxococcales bacterium]|nr:dihydrolipoamide acetyltransferase family protein [Myxococcales bacterium]